MSKRSFLRKSALSLAATLSLGGSVTLAQINIPPDQTANSSDDGPSSLGNQTVTFSAAGGTLTLNGTGVVANNRLQERWFDTEFGTGFLNPISNLINATSEIDGELSGPLNYRGDAGFTPVTNPGAGGLSDLETFSGLWTGTMTITTAGDYGFATGSDDGSVLWIDLNKDGTFGSGELVVDRNLDTGYGRTGTATRNLAAGSYPIAIGFYENGGGNDMEALIQQPGGTLDFIDPSNASQAGMWSYIDNVSTNANFSTNPIVVNASGTINVDATKSLAATVGATTIARGVTLTTNGARLNAPSTALTGTGDTVTFAGTGTFNAGAFNAGATPVNIVQNGTGGVLFSRIASTVAEGSTIVANGGTVGVAVGANSTSVGTAPVTLNGGTLALLFDPTAINGPGHFGTVGEWYVDDNIFDPLLAQDSTNTFGWSGLDSKAQLDTKLGARTVFATRNVNIPINFPRGDGNPDTGSTNEAADAVFDTGGANLGVGVNGTGANALFAARFTGKLNVTTAGPTPFTLLSNDGAVMFIDMDQGPGQNWQKVVDSNRYSTNGGATFGGYVSGQAGAIDGAFAADPAAPNITQPAVPNLAVGEYDYIVGTFNAAENNYGIELFWTPPGGTRTLVPFAGELNSFNFTNTVSASGNSGLTVERPTTMPNITLADGTVLNVSGNRVTMAQTTVSGTVQVNMNHSAAGYATFNPGNIVPATEGAPWTFIKGGNSTFNASGPNFSSLTSDHGIGVAGGRLIADGARGTTGASIGSAKIVLGGGTFVANSGILETPGAANTLTEYWYHTNGNVPETAFEPPDLPGGLLRTPPTGSMALTESLVQFGDKAETGDTVLIGDRWGRVDQVAAGWFGEWTFSGGAGHGNEYTFASKSDDGSVIWIDLDGDGRFEGGGGRVNDGTVPNEMVLDNNFYQGDTTRNGVRTIPDGTYRVWLGWYEGGGDATSSFKFARGNFPAANNAEYDASANLVPIDPTVTTVVSSKGRSYDLNADTGNASFSGNAVEVVGGTTTLQAGGPSKFGAMTFTNTATVNTTGNKTSIASVTTSNGTGTLNNGLGPDNLSVGDVGASAGATTILSGDNRIVSGGLTGEGTVQIANGVVQFTNNGASTGTGTLDLRPNPSPGAAASAARFNPGAAGTFSAPGVTAITNEGLLHAEAGTVDLSGAVATTTVVAELGTVAGLMEGRVPGAFNITSPNPGPVGGVGGIKLEPIMAQTSGSGNVEPWPDNTTYIYTGQMFFPDNGTPGDGISEFAMVEHVDDSTQIKINGVERLNDSVWNAVNTTGRLELPVGWHDVEFRFGEGGGGWGPSTNTDADGDPNNPWDITLGFGVDFISPIEADLQQPSYQRPVDPGDATVFRFVRPEAGVVRVANGATLKLGAVRGSNAVEVQGTGRLELHGPASKIAASALSIAGTPAAPTATLDLTDSGIVLDYPEAGPSPAADVRSQIIAGRGTPGLIGSWDGEGITSSTSTAAPDSTSVGYAVNGEMPLGPVATYGGLDVDDSSVIIRHTRIGDANLDGVVNDDDVTIVGAFYAPGVPNASWANGDFDYNGFVDDDDVTLLGALYDPAATPIPAAPAGGGAIAAVPEPSTWLMLTLGGLSAGLFGWRRRRQS